MAADFRRDLVTDGVLQSRIDAQIERSRRRIQSAPLVILLCMDMNEMTSYSDERRLAAERSMAIQSVAAAGTQLLLAAHAEGLGGVWVCSPLFTPETVLNTLKLPANWEPQAMFFIGYSEETPQPRERLALQEISIFIREGMSVE
jgi:F420 biosynthesis protein FbiB-like protein